MEKEEITKEQLVEAVGILTTKFDTINERTKKHTKKIMELRREINDLREHF